MISLKKKIRCANPRIYSDKTIIKWQRWESFSRISKDGKEIKKIDKVDKFGTRKEFLKIFLQDVHDMALHVFNWKWHDHQFDFFEKYFEAWYAGSSVGFCSKLYEHSCR